MSMSIVEPRSAAPAICLLVGSGFAGGGHWETTPERDTVKRKSAKKQRYKLVRKAMGQLSLLSEAPEHDPSSGHLSNDTNALL